MLAPLDPPSVSSALTHSLSFSLSFTLSLSLSVVHPCPLSLVLPHFVVLPYPRGECSFLPACLPAPAPSCRIVPDASRRRSSCAVTNEGSLLPEISPSVAFSFPDDVVVSPAFAYLTRETERERERPLSLFGTFLPEILLLLLRWAAGCDRRLFLDSAGLSSVAYVD